MRVAAVSARLLSCMDRVKLNDGIVLFGARLCSLGADSLVLFLTLAEVYAVYKACRTLDRSPLLGIMAREG